MAKPLPDFTALGPTRAPRPEAGVAKIDTSGLDSEQSVNRAMIAAGGSLMAGAGDLAVAQDRFDTMVAEDAYNKLRDRQTDLSVGPDGFAQKKGGDAVMQPLLADYSGQFGDAQKEISGSLQNDRQRAKFDQRAGVAQIQFKQDVLRHVYAESAVYGKQILDGGFKTEVRNAQVSWQDPYAVAASRDRLDMMIDNTAKQFGWPKEQTDATRQSARTEIATAVIGSAVANGDIEYAKGYYDAHREDLDLHTQNALLKTIEVGKQRTLVNGYQADFLDSRDSVKMLDALEVAVTKDKEIDEGNRNMLLGRIMGRRDVVENRAERERLKIDRTIEKAIGQVNTLTLQGFEPTIEQMQPIVEMARGTDLEGEALRMVGTANATRSFRQAPPAQQEAYLARLEADVRKDPTKFDVNAVKHFRTIFDNQQREVQADPISFAIRQGFAEPTPIDLAQPDAASGAIAERAAVARGMQARYQVPLKILTKEEKDLLLGVLKATPTNGKRDYFASISRATGGDTDVYNAIMGQLAPDDPVTAIAGVFAGRGVKDDKGNQVADLLIRGQAIMRPNRKEDGTPDKGHLWPLPQGQDEKTMRTLFADYERDAFAGHPQARSDHFQAAMSIYAAKSADAGDASGTIDTSRWRESIKLATGGIERYNGRSVVMPWGLDYGKFKTGVRDRIDELQAAGAFAEGVSTGKLRDLPIENVGDGRYVFRAGDGILVGKNKRPILIDFNKPIQGKAAPTAAEFEHASMGDINAP